MGINRDGHDDVVYFVGPEVEHTCTHGAKTLFINGVRNPDQTEEFAEEHGCKHLYFGANKSFQKNKLLIEYITRFIKSGYQVTLDYPVADHQWVLDNMPREILSDRNFIPMISCEIPEVETFNQNVTVKIDDSDFKNSNRGVWTLGKGDMLDSNRFTDWKEYGNDEVIWTAKDQKKMLNDKRANVYGKKGKDNDQS